MDPRDPRQRDGSARLTRVRRDRFGDRRIRELLREARTARPSLRRIYWNHAAFLATRYPGWSSAPDGQGRQTIYELTSVGSRGATYGVRHFVTREPSRERVVFHGRDHWFVAARAANRYDEERSK